MLSRVLCLTTALYHRNHHGFVRMLTNVLLLGSFFPCLVFDPDGNAGDAAFRAVKFQGSDQILDGEGVFKFLQDPPFLGNPDIEEVEGSTGGYKGLYIELPSPLIKGMNQKFGVDMDGNSIAKIANDKWQPGAYPDDGTRGHWDLGGVSGSELIGSRFYVQFDNGATAMGYIGHSSGKGVFLASVFILSSSECSSTFSWCSS